MIPSHLYFTEGKKKGIPDSTLSRAVDELTRARNAGVQAVFSLGHLAHLTGASYPYLREIVSRSRDPYRSIKTPKGAGGFRELSAPEPVIADVQRWLLKNVLSGVPEHPASYAYRRGRSIVQCAEQHCGSRWMIKLDMHDFFDSVSESKVYRIFQKIGYSNLVSFELARITTRATDVYRTPHLVATHKIPAYVNFHQGRLPQGAPTSGLLANAVARNLDDTLQNFAVTNGFAYTRYSDDMVFSTSADFDREKAVRAIQEVTLLVRRAGFSIHRKKTRVVPPGARKIVLGLLVDEQVRLLPESRRRIEVHLRGCENYGLAQHVKHRGFESVFSFLNHLEGWIAFAIGVEPQRALAWRARLNQLLADNRISPYAASDS